MFNIKEFLFNLGNPMQEFSNDIRLVNFSLFNFLDIRFSKLLVKL